MQYFVADLFRMILCANIYQFCRRCDLNILAYFCFGHGVHVYTKPTVTPCTRVHRTDSHNTT